MLLKLLPGLLVLALIAIAGCSDDSTGTNHNAVCGNGVQENAEECDGADFNSQTCVSQGFVDGALSCTESCELDTSSCISSWPCGDGVVNPGEECDDDNTDDHDGCGAFCQEEQGWTCDGEPSTCTTICSDAIVTGLEECDDGNLRSHDGCSSGCTTEHPIWVQVQTPTRPSNRGPGFNMVFDQQRAVTVLFGGFHAEPPDEYHWSDTWEYDGADWVRIVPDATPPGRVDHAMTYDSSRGTVVLFGGTGSTSFLGDTWEYDGTTWTEVLPGLSPPLLSDSEMVFDSGRGIAVLFGVWGPGTPPLVTWEYDGTTWTSVTSPVVPERRSFHSMVFDPTTQSAMLHAGADIGGQRSDVWEYDGSVWSEVVQNDLESSDARFTTELVFDKRAGCVVRFGGSVSGPADEVGGMHRFDGLGWVDLHPENPPPDRAHHRMVYDTVRQTVVLFGGLTANGVSQDTWEYYWDSNWPDEICDNASDDDSDGLVDCADPDCTGIPPC